jgi:hypothetical protein
MTSVDGSSAKIRLALLARDHKKSKTAAATFSNSLPGNTWQAKLFVTRSHGCRFLAQQPQRGTESTMIKAGPWTTLVPGIGTASAAPSETNALRPICLENESLSTAHWRSSHRFAPRTALSIYSLREIPSLAARCFINLLARRDSFICIRTFPVRGRPRGRFFAAFCTPRGS